MKKNRLLVLALLATTGCAVDPGVVAAIGAALADDPTAPRPSGAPVTTTGLPVPGLPTTNTGMHDPVGGSEPEQALDVVNQARKLAGLDPVVLDAEMSAACAKHCHYLVLNQDSPAVTEGLNAHQEDTSLPGATPEGAAAGKASDISWNSNPVSAVMGLVGSLYHRTPILSSKNTKIGFAIERDAAGYTVSVLMFGGDSGAERKVVAFPANGQTDVPLSFDHNERPDPTPNATGPTGYPVTLALPQWKKATNVKGQIFDAAGKDLPLFQSDNEHPASDFQQGDVLCLFTKAPFKPGATYKVVASADVEGNPMHWEWSFTTAVPLTVDASDKAALKKAAGHLTRVTGKVTYGGSTTGGGSKFLDFGDGVVAFIDNDVWSATKLGDAAKLKGKTVRILCTPSVRKDGSSVDLKPVKAEDLEVT